MGAPFFRPLFGRKGGNEVFLGRQEQAGKQKITSETKEAAGRGLLSGVSHRSLTIEYFADW